ncbi:MAG: Na+/H+ antiporter subunit E [Sedimenticola sp.]|nr:Na+/H+ antiporter subunit E [Sedimenticola sp.]
MMTRLLPHPALTLVLAVAWVLMANTLSLTHMTLGLLLGWIIPLFTLRFWPERVTIRRPWLLLRFVGILLTDIVIANFIVAGLILRGPKPLTPALVKLPLALHSDLAISLLSNTICLTPGTVSASLSQDRGHLLVHALNTDDPQALIQRIKLRYEAPLKEIFEP